MWRSWGRQSGWWKSNSVEPARGSRRRKNRAVCTREVCEYSQSGKILTPKNIIPNKHHRHVPLGAAAMATTAEAGLPRVQEWVGLLLPCFDLTSATSPIDLRVPAAQKI